jgi:GNAT superfamily N-acetyltransferase
MSSSASGWSIRQARPDDFPALGKLLVSAYAALPGMPSPEDWPPYYAMLENVAARAANPAFTVFVAADDNCKLLGSIDYIDDLAQYGVGSVATITDAAGVRLLAVDGACQGQGVGKGLAKFCIEHARRTGKARIILHTTRLMQTAWTMYERLGFVRFPEIDFQVENIDVFGFWLEFTATEGPLT